jgi:hypothetical protein
MSSARHAMDLKKKGFIFNTIFLIGNVFGCKSNTRKWALQYLILGKKHEFMSFDGLTLQKSLIFAGLPTPPTMKRQRNQKIGVPDPGTAEP